MAISEWFKMSRPQRIAAIVLTALSITLIGDGLRDALDPKMKN